MSQQRERKNNGLPYEMTREDRAALRRASLSDQGLAENRNRAQKDLDMLRAEECTDDSLLRPLVDEINDIDQLLHDRYTV